ncbi:hypothetical protein UUC_17295 [Rhodanobacter denitrificans]|uniref:hypothetical protein n=1 Tax=Rhodanobacter denitrificans TaxID=666685 RepID=UPI000261033B|nr:hypothetical protein [Rhodanobacter denitrificans]EIL98393.1 hypothetical protein UUC_17295 [Rhodanobacter denitrificans]
MDAVATPDTMPMPADNLVALEASHAHHRGGRHHFFLPRRMTTPRPPQEPGMPGERQPDGAAPEQARPGAAVERRKALRAKPIEP